MDILTLVKAAIALVAGAAGRYIFPPIIAPPPKDTLELKAKQILLDAKESAQKTLDEAKSRAEKISEEAKREQKEQEKELRKIEERLAPKDEKLKKNTPTIF